MAATPPDLDAASVVADTEAEPSAALRTVVLAAWPLFASVLLLTAGSGLQGSLLGVRAEVASFNSTVTGLVLGLYYLGYVAGSLWVPKMLRNVGHIRVFASLVSLASASVVIHGVWVSPVPWMALRFTTGLCVAGLFIVSESWLNDVSTSATRGTMLAVYNTVVTAGLTVGSLLLNVANPSGIVLFVIGSVLLSIAAVPVTLAPHEAPPPREFETRSVGEVFRSAPLGITGSSMAGLAVGASVGFGAVYATRAGFGVSGASQFIASLLIGAVIGQIPLGRWSDRTDRRIVMGAAGVLIVGGSAVGVAATLLSSFLLVLGAGLLIGAGGFSLYGLSFAHVADYIEPDAMASTGARIIMFNGLGAATGPFLASAAISIFGPEGLFYVLAGVASCFVVLVGYRLTRRAAVSDERRSHYTPLATSATYGVIDETVSEVVGLEPEELHRRKLRIPDAMRRPLRRSH